MNCYAGRSASMAKWDMPRIVFDGFDLDDERRREALLTLGNGVLSCRASAPEVSARCPAPEHYPGLYRAGWYDQAPRRVNGQTVALGALVRLPDPLGLSFSVDDGHWFSLRDTEILVYRQSLNLSEGLLERYIRLVVGGTELRLNELRFVSMADPNLLVLRWCIEADGQLQPVRIRTTLNGDVANALVGRSRAYEGRRLETVRLMHDKAGHTVLWAHLPGSRRRMMVASMTAATPVGSDWTGRVEEDCISLESDHVLIAQQPLVLEKRVVVRVDTELPDDTRHQHGALQKIPDTSFEELKTAHQRAWQALWDRIALRARDEKLERALYFSMFHLLQTVSPLSLDYDQGFPPRGWQEGYFGQIFWDEMFAFPFLSTHFPELARHLLAYRHRRLDVARDDARRAGLKGAMFPWRSAASGHEETPPFQCNPLSGRWMVDNTHLQRHVGTAVVYDVWQLYLATNDRGLLTGAGGEMILEVAHFWSSMAQYDARLKRYVILRVIGPDEYHNGYPGADHPGLDNNAYTNLMAVWTLCRALDVLALIPTEQKAAFRRRLALDDAEISRWDDISRRMYIPLLDSGIISQFDGYESLIPAPREWLTASRPRLDWWLEARHDSCDRYQLTKQADVLMLLHLFPPSALRAMLHRLGYPVEEDFNHRTAHYHLARITHESSLSKMVCAGALAHVDSKASWQHFCDCLYTDLDAPSHGGVQEGVHLGAMAGSLDVLQRHYFGIRPELNGLHVFPAPPAALDDISLALEYRGARITAALSEDRLCLTLALQAREPIEIVHEGGTACLSPGQTLALSVPRASVKVDPRS